MSKKITQAIARLKSKGYFIEEINKDKFAEVGCLYPREYTARELIKFARIWSSNNSQNTTLKENVKADSRTERRFVRDEIAKGNDDLNFPKHKYADRWDYD